LWPSAHLRAQIDPQDAEALSDYLGYRARPSTGPYRVESVSEARIVATRNPHFPLTPAPIARVELHHFADEEALSAALRAGAIDLITPNALSAEALGAFEDHPKLRAVA